MFTAIFRPKRAQRDPPLDLVDVYLSTYKQNNWEKSLVTEGSKVMARTQVTVGAVCNYDTKVVNSTDGSSGATQNRCGLAALTDHDPSVAS